MNRRGLFKSLLAAATVAVATKLGLGDAPAYTVENQAADRLEWYKEQLEVDEVYRIRVLGEYRVPYVLVSREEAERRFPASPWDHDFNGET